MGNYKIKDIEILTGIKAHTIRIWEKRYGILTPIRKKGKIRSYTDDDLKQILNIAILNKNGVKISKIADLNNSQIAQKIEDNNRKFPDQDIHYENLLLSLLNLDENAFNQTMQALVSKIGWGKTFEDYLSNFL